MPSSGGKTCALRSEEHTSELQSHDNLVCRLLLEKNPIRSEEHTSELQSHENLVCRLLLEKKKWRTSRRPAGPPRLKHTPSATCAGARRVADTTLPRARRSSSVAVCAPFAFLFFFIDRAPPEFYPLPLPGAFPI